MTLNYRGVVYRKNTEVRFIIPTDHRIVDPQTKNILWRKGSLEFFSKDKLSCYIKENGTKNNIRISLFCVLPLN